MLPSVRQLAARLESGERERARKAAAPPCLLRMEWIRGEGHQHSGPILLPPSLSLLHWNCVCCFSSGQGSLSFSSSSSSSPSSTIYQSLYITSCFLSTFSLGLSPFYPPPFLAAASLTKTNCCMLLIFFCSLLLCPPYVPPSPIEDNQQQRIRRQKGKKREERNPYGVTPGAYPYTIDFISSGAPSAHPLVAGILFLLPNSGRCLSVVMDSFL